MVSLRSERMGDWTDERKNERANERTGDDDGEDEDDGDVMNNIRTTGSFLSRSIFI